MIFNIILALIGSTYSKKKSGKISTHDYIGQAKLLDNHRVSCGYKGSEMDLNRISAQSGINNYPCGTCVKINKKGDSSKIEYFVVVDKGGVNFDLSTTAFGNLFGEKTGIHEAEWEKVPQSHCVGVLKGEAAQEAAKTAGNAEDDDEDDTKPRSGKISTHDYIGQAKLLDNHRVSCGYKGSEMDLNRISAQSGKNNYPCGTCVEINKKGDTSKVEYFVVVDKGGVNFDLSTTAFGNLFGEKTGIHEAEWKKAPQSKCKGILKGEAAQEAAKTAGNGEKENDIDEPKNMSSDTLNDNIPQENSQKTSKQSNSNISDNFQNKEKSMTELNNPNQEDFSTNKPPGLEELDSSSKTAPFDNRISEENDPDSIPAQLPSRRRRKHKRHHRRHHKRPHHRRRHRKSKSQPQDISVGDLAL